MTDSKRKETTGERLTRWVYAVGPSGLAPVAPGTAGSFTAAILIFLPGHLGIPSWSFVFAAIALVVVFFAGVWSAGQAERIHGRDPGIVVIDELAGMIVTLMAIENSLVAIVLGFFLFRAMDILKPFPARRLENAPGGWGVMLDDVMAGVYANLLLRGALLVWAAVF